MSYTMMVLLSYTILPAAITGLIRFKIIDPLYYPVLFCVLLGTVNEIISTLLVHQHMGNAVNSNIYVLAEALLLLWQFRQWGLFAGRRGMFPGILILLLIGWVIENYNFGRLNVFDPYFRVSYAMLVIIMSVLTIQTLVITYNGALYKSARFILCCGFLIFFSFKIFTEIFLVYGAYCSRAFQDAVFKAGAWSNVILNFLYLIAFLWIPPKPRYMMP